MSLEFQRGDRVEVKGNQEGLIGSYFEATIISRIRDGEFIVEYMSLISDDTLEPLREIVASAYLRPRPPPEKLKVNDLEPQEVVDAWDNEGWWRGTVVKRWRKGDRRYDVFFEDTGDKKSYYLPNLRAHCDWVNGRWVCSRKDFDIN